MRQSLEERFWKSVQKRAEDECWEWGRSRNAKGYGVIYLGKQLLTHRVAWQLAHGPIPDGLCVLHRCDNPPCVNERHLFLGTHSDNTKDMHMKGRWSAPPPAGEKNGHSKLTLEQVNLILALARCGVFTRRTIGRTFGISAAHTSHIVIGRAWANVDGVVRC